MAKVYSKEEREQMEVRESLMTQLDSIKAERGGHITEAVTLEEFSAEHIPMLYGGLKTVGAEQVLKDLGTEPKLVFTAQQQPQILEALVVLRAKENMEIMWGKNLPTPESTAFLQKLDSLERKILAAIEKLLAQAPSVPAKTQKVAERPDRVLPPKEVSR